MADIFISYKSDDRARVKPLARLLEGAGWAVWWDQELLAGTSWDSTISTELARARCVIVAWSKFAVESDWVKDEARIAHKAGKLIPILLDPVIPPLGFGSLQVEDFSTWHGGRNESEFRHLCDAIHAKLHTKPPATEMPVMSEEERLLAAYRESGRTLVALNLPAVEPVRHATINPRGCTATMTMQLPERNNTSISLEQMTSRLAIMMAARAAEELAFGRERVTSAAAFEIEQATNAARLMVTRWGFSKRVGIVAYGENASEASAKKIDAEIKRLGQAAYRDAKRILTEKRDQLHILARALMEFETLSGEEIKDLLWGKPPTRLPVGRIS